MTLRIDKSLRTPNSFTLKPGTIKLLDEIAEQYDTNRSRVIEAMVTQYGPKLLESLKKGKSEE